MIRKNMILMILITLLTIFLTSCSNTIEFVNITNNTSNLLKDEVISPNPDILKKQVFLYFANRYSTKLNRVKITISYTPNHLAEAIIDELIRRPKYYREFNRIISPNLDILSVKEVEKSVFVNFSSKNLYGGIKEESLLISSIVKSLTEIDYIEKVYFLVDGKKIKSLMGNISAKNYFTKDSVEHLLQNTDPNLSSSKYIMKLWFPLFNTIRYTYEVKLSNDPPSPKSVIGGLLLGPSNINSKDCIPSNIEILDVKTIDKTVYVDFSSKNLFVYRGDSSLEYNMYYCIVKSLLNLESVDEVIFLVDGKAGFKLIEKVSIYYPFTESNVDLLTSEIDNAKKPKYKITIFQPSKIKFPPNFVRWEKIIFEYPTPEVIISNLMVIPKDEQVNPRFTIPYIKNIWQKDKTVYINFSEYDIEMNFEKYKKLEVAIISSIVRSLCELDSVDEVMFLIDNNVKDVFIEKTNINSPLNYDSIVFEDEFNFQQ